MARQRGAAAGLQSLVEHAFDDDGPGRVVGARFGAQAEKSDAIRVDVVPVHEPHDRRGSHRIDALRGAAHPEAVADDGAGLVPDVVGPATPRLEVDAVRRHVDGKAADTHFFGHRTPSFAFKVGAVALAPPPQSARDYMTNPWQSTGPPPEVWPRPSVRHSQVRNPTVRMRAFRHKRLA
jgi:hypothetical protein